MLIPCGHRVLVKPKEIQTQTASGIIVVSNERDAKMEKLGNSRGVVVAIGSTAWKMESLGNKNWAEIGDEVYYAKYGGTLIIDPETDEEFVMLNDQDIAVLIKREEEKHD